MEVEIQKQTYISIMLLNSFLEDAFLAKSATLDFLFGCSNSCTAIMSLNECLSEDNHLAKMGLNEVYGIVLAVEEYKELFSVTIIHKFIITLINVISYKIGDTSIENYETCMNKILNFIGDNIDYDLISHFLRVSLEFIYCEKSQKEKIFDTYHKVLEKSCKRLKLKNSKLFFYKIDAEKNMIVENINNNEDEDSKKILEKIYEVINDVSCNDMIMVIDNDENLGAYVQEHINKVVPSDCVNHIEDRSKILKLCFDEYDKMILAVNCNKRDFFEMMYYLGKLEEKMEIGHLLVCFDNNDSGNVYLQKLVDRYSDKASFPNKLKKLLG